MSDLELREFRTRAEELVDLPDLAELEGRGRRLRQRRVALGAGLAAAVLAVTGGLVAANQRDDADSTPIEPPDDRAPAEVVDYPGAVMETLDAGTYLMQPSRAAGAPEVLVTLPPGWNAWEGPNRFEGDLDTTPWYAGLLVVNVTAVATDPCDNPAATGTAVDGTPDDLVAAIKRIPGLRVTATPESDQLFGYPATHLQVRRVPGFGRCDGDFALFDTETNGVVVGGIDTLADTWVVDVDGQAFLVDAGVTPKTPPEIQEELYAIVDAIEFVDPE
ncbi:MAG TPA: hypothetical protein VFO49_05365 [Nocardioides sp.]|nr:hypothetical protein [Nocardioides sp.]